jgi:hypothetical protein
MTAHQEAQEALVEVFWKAFQGLTKRQKELFLGRLLADPELGEDLMDALLIEEARRESGEDVPLRDYIAQHRARSK